MEKTMTLSRNDDVIVIWKKKEIINTYTIFVTICSIIRYREITQ